MNHPNLNSLRIFAAAARHGSFQRAALALNLSQGAVSQRIKQLEAELGTPLFDRQPRGVTLTPQGAAYRTAVDEALALIARATEALTGQDRLILHLGPSFAAKWLMPRMQDLRAACPGLTLMTEVHDSLLTRPLGRGELAIWPARQPPGDPAHHIRHLADIRLSAVCSPGFARAHGLTDSRTRPVTVETLLALPLLQDAHRHWDRLIGSSGHRGPVDLLNFDRSALALDAAAQGHGLAIAADLMAGADLATGRLVAVWRPPAEAGAAYYLSWPRRHERDAALRQVVGWLLAQFEAADAAPCSPGD